MNTIPTNPPKRLELLATLWPDMPHYEHFAKSDKVDAIRLNTAMADPKTIKSDLTRAIDASHGTKLYLDVKGRQLRITDVDARTDHLECTINHPIEVATPTPVLFKAGADGALLERVEGNRLIFAGGPKYRLRPGESLQIRHSSLRTKGPLFTSEQIAYLDAAMELGMGSFMLSYTGSMAEVETLRRVVGDAEIVAKIEDNRGLAFAKNEYRRQPNLNLLCARGDLYVEVDRPHDILQASKDLLKADPDAIVGSRILLSVTDNAVPECSDISELAWLMDAGYHRFMFCDGLCLKKDALERALDITRAVHADYTKESTAASSSYKPLSSSRMAKLGGFFDSWRR